jgi:hypothetical protein
VAKKRDATYDRLIKVGLQDPFIRGIAGVVVIATAASIAISALGSGAKAIITPSAAVIMTVFLVFTVLLVPAAVICWPQPYAQLLSLPNCLAQIEKAAAQIEKAMIEKPFTPVAYTGTGITHNPDNDKYLVLVFYRPERKQDAERIVGALRSAGYRSDGTLSSLDEVVTPNRHPDMTLIKTTTLARPIVGDVFTIVRFAIPVKASSVALFPEDAPLRGGNIQISLF